MSKKRGKNIQEGESQWVQSTERKPAWPEESKGRPEWCEMRQETYSHGHVDRFGEIYDLPQSRGKSVIKGV